MSKIKAGNGIESDLTCLLIESNVYLSIGECLTELGIEFITESNDLVELLLREIAELLGVGDISCDGRSVELIGAGGVVVVILAVAENDTVGAAVEVEQSAFLLVPFKLAEAVLTEFCTCGLGLIVLDHSAGIAVDTEGADAENIRRAGLEVAVRQRYAGHIAGSAVLGDTLCMESDCFTDIVGKDQVSAFELKGKAYRVGCEDIIVSVIFGIDVLRGDLTDVDGFVLYGEGSLNGAHLALLGNNIHGEPVALDVVQVGGVRVGAYLKAVGETGELLTVIVRGVLLVLALDEFHGLQKGFRIGIGYTVHNVCAVEHFGDILHHAVYIFCICISAEIVLLA